MKIALLSILILLLTSLPTKGQNEITFIKTPEDLSFEYGEEGDNLTWIAISNNASVYLVTVDNNLYAAGEWSSNQSITIPIIELLPNYYNFTIELHNDYGYVLYDSVSIDRSSTSAT